MSDRPASDKAGSRARIGLLVVLPVLVFAALAALFAARLIAGGDPSRLPSPLIGRQAPATDLPALPGLHVPGLTNADLRSDRVTVVNVWASWCAPCRIEHPILRELGRAPSIRVVGLNYKDKPENARRFLGAYGNPFKAIGVDESGRTAIDWGVYGVPETFVVAPDGVIRFKQVGPLTDENLPAFREQVRRAAQPLDGSS